MTKLTIENVADISYGQDNILTFRLHDKSNIELEEAKKIYNAASKLAGDRMHCNFMDMRKMTYMSGEARKFFGSQDKSTVKAIAVISNKVLHKPLINLYMKFSKPQIPTRFFETEDAALAWLKESMHN